MPNHSFRLVHPDMQVERADRACEDRFVSRQLAYPSEDYGVTESFLVYL
jgi:hypothetical protein